MTTENIISLNEAIERQAAILNNPDSTLEEKATIAKIIDQLAEPITEYDKLDSQERMQEKQMKHDEKMAWINLASTVIKTGGDISICIYGNKMAKGAYMAAMKFAQTGVVDKSLLNFISLTKLGSRR